MVITTSNIYSALSSFFLFPSCNSITCYHFEIVPWFLNVLFVSYFIFCLQFSWEAFMDLSSGLVILSPTDGLAKGTLTLCDSVSDF